MILKDYCLVLMYCNDNEVFGEIVMANIADPDLTVTRECAYCKVPKFSAPENFAVIYLKFKQRGQTLWFFADCSSRSSLIWVCTVCPDLLNCQKT